MHSGDGRHGSGGAKQMRVAEFWHWMLPREAADIFADFRNHFFVDVAGDGMAAVTFRQVHHAYRYRHPAQNVGMRRSGIARPGGTKDRKSTRLNSSHSQISYA